MYCHIDHLYKFNINKKLFDMLKIRIEINDFVKVLLDVTFMHLVDILNDFLLMLNFIKMIYMIIVFNPMVNFVIRICDEIFSEVSCY